MMSSVVFLFYGGQGSSQVINNITTHHTCCVKCRVPLTFASPETTQTALDVAILLTLVGDCNGDPLLLLLLNLLGDVLPPDCGCCSDGLTNSTDEIKRRKENVRILGDER